MRKLELLEKGESLDFDENAWYPFGGDSSGDLVLVRLVQGFRFLSGVLFKSLTNQEACVYFGPLCGAGKSCPPLIFSTLSHAYVRRV